MQQFLKLKSKYTMAKNQKKLNKKIHKIFMQATQSHQQGQLSLAKQLYQQTLEIAPNHADSLHLLGLIIADEGNPQQGLQLITKAIKLHKNFAAYYLNRGLIYKRLQEYESAISDYQKAIKLEPKSWQAYSNLGDTYLAQEQHDQAIDTYKKVIQLNPVYKNSYHNIANAYLWKKLHHEAIEYYQKTLAIDHQCVESLNGMGVSLHALEKHDAAINCYKKVLQINPNCAQAYANWGLLLTDLNRPQEASEKHKKTIELEPNSAHFYSNLGISYKEQNQIDPALKALQKAVDLDPQDVKARFNLSITQLVAGDFEHGWINYESRFKLPERKRGEYHFPQPIWQGEDLSGKTLFIHIEQGLGDTIQFVRYIPLVMQYGGNIILESQKELLTLLQAQFPTITVIPRWNPPAEFDYHIAIMSLPLLFKTTLETIPAAGGYLKNIDPRSTNWVGDDRLEVLLPDNTKHLKVGIVWAGGELHKNNKNRSLSLEVLKPIFNNKNVDFYSLQYGKRAQDLESYGLSTQIKDLSPCINDFADTAAILKKLDILISVDTAVAHLGGALGIPTWILLPYAPDFRWLLNTENSPWYNSVRLFRQPKVGDRQSVITQLNIALKQCTQGKKNSLFKKLWKIICSK
jgi:tetratricopeptide (TPR) repeat protein